MGALIESIRGSCFAEWTVSAFDWLVYHLVELFLIALIAILAFGGYGLIIAQHQYTEQQIDLCVRAFERARDQCEFIVRNRIMPPQEP
jgi:hypothetical protein